MSDLDRQPSEEGGNKGFGDEWQRLARSDTGAVVEDPPEDDRHDDGQAAQEPDGQAAEGGQPSEAAPQLTEPAAEPEDDIWAEAPESLRNAYRAEREARLKAENQVRTHNGRVSKAERDAAALRAQLLARQQPAPAAQPPAPPEDQAARRDKLVGEYEDVVAPIADEVLELRQQLASLVAANASQQEQESVRHQLELKEFLEAEEGLLKDAHPDWAEVVMEPAFVQWVQGGPQFIRDGIARNGNGIVDHLEAAKIIDLFKAESGRVPRDDPMAARRRRQLEAGREVPARTPGTTLAAGAPESFEAEWKRLGAIERRQQAGRQ